MIRPNQPKMMSINHQAVVRRQAVVHHRAVARARRLQTYPDL